MATHHSDFTDRDVEVYARAMWDILLALNIQDGHCKSYDPLTIERISTTKSNRIVAHTYVFNLWDGGRHHESNSLKQIQEAIRDETLEYLKAWKEGGFDNDPMCLPVLKMMTS